MYNAVTNNTYTIKKQQEVWKLYKCLSVIFLLFVENIKRQKNLTGIDKKQITGHYDHNIKRPFAPSPFILDHI